MNTNEYDSRIKIVNSILNTPHGKLDDFIPLHKEMVKEDPLFYLKFAIYYDRNLSTGAEVRDHKKLFSCLAMTLPGNLSIFRNLGEHLLVKMNPKDILTTVKIIMQSFGGSSGGKRRRLRKCVEKYLRNLEEQAEKNSNRFLKNSRFIRKLYTSLRIAPSDKAVVSLKLYKRGFKPNANPYEAFSHIKDLSTAVDEETICTIISKYKLPALNCIGALKVKMTPAIAAAIYQNMSAKEKQILTNMLKKQGLLEDKEFKKLVKKDLKKNAGKLSMRGIKAVKVMDEHADIMNEVTDSFVDSLPTVNQKVLICIDRSRSMEKAIPLGKDISSILSSKIENPKENLMIILFNSSSQVVPLPEKSKFSNFETTFRFTSASGTTSLGSPIKKALELGFNPTVIVFITDGKESETPFIESVVKDSNLYLVKFICCLIGDKVKQLELPDKIKADKRIEIDNVDFTNGDYFGLPNLLNVIARGGIRGLIDEIDSLDLYEEINRYKRGE